MLSIRGSQLGQPIKIVLQCCALSVIYYISARVGLALAFEQANTSPVWPPSGISIAAVLIFGFRIWPGIFVGAFLVNLSAGSPFPIATTIAIGNTLEALTAGYLIIRFADRQPFSTIVHSALFVIFIALSTMVSATVGVTTLVLNEIVSAYSFSLLWKTWWLGDAVGGLIVTPLLVTWMTLPPFRFTKRRIIEAIVLAIITGILLIFTFSNWSVATDSSHLLIFMLLPLLAWSAERFQRHGATLLMAVLSTSAIIATMYGHGPFVMATENESLLLLQASVGATMVTALMLVASQEERMFAHRQIKDVQQSLESQVARRTEELRATNIRLETEASVFKESADAIMICTDNLKIIRVNPAFSRITGYSTEEAVGQSPNFLQSGMHPPSFYKDYWDTLGQTGIWQGEMTNRRKSGEMFPTWQTASVVYDNDGNLSQYISIFSDISEKKLTEERIYNLANNDIVTGLPNRASFHEKTNTALEHAKRMCAQLAIMFIDLDHFKLINDTSGHPVGDLLLQQVANRLKKTIRLSDTISRFGGDEFTLLMPQIKSTDEVAIVAKKVLRCLAEPFLLDGNELIISASIGIGIYPQNGGNAEALLKNADSAMYQAKELGRNNFQFFTAEMNRQAEERLELERDLRKALKNEEFLLHYQPQVDIVSGKITGFEALIRWQHPTIGLISPAKFIPVAEASGLIVPIGQWVLKTACVQHQHWKSQGCPPLRIAVNLSGRQFSQGDLLPVIQNAIESSGITPSDLELEITESMMMDNTNETIDILNKIRALGIRLSMDDFGTGYSSMAYLKRFPINKLKIDQSFVRDLPGDSDDGAIVEATIAIAHALNLTVIAEGVETHEQLQFLNKLHCEEIQGYYVSRPLSVDDITALLKGSSSVITPKQALI